MFKFRYKGEYFTFEGYTFDDAINDMDLMLNLNGKNNWVQSQYDHNFIHGGNDNGSTNLS